MKKKLIIIIGVIISIIILAIIFAVIFYSTNLKSVSNVSEDVPITINSGATSSDIGILLKEKDLIRNEVAFKIYTKLNRINNMQAGDYILNKNMNVSEIISSLQEGPDSKNATVNLTFLEGKNMRWVAKLISQSTNNTEDDVYNTLKDESYLNSLINKYWFINDEIKNKDIYYSLEGYLFPDTYNVKKDASVQDIFDLMIEQMSNKLEPYRNEIENKNISVHKLLTAASIIELEASNSEDRKNVASVIYNRISKNMSIGSDVTTYYAIKVDMGERDLKQSEINLVNPYNTRSSSMNGKLPVGPIAMCSLDSILAALYPNTTNYLYFVADINKKVYFAENSEGHQKNIDYLKKNNLWYTYD